MRAFVQTFVLAPESPKKYYVRNDFFRYQDDDISNEGEPNEAAGQCLVPLRVVSPAVSFTNYTIACLYSLCTTDITHSLYQRVCCEEIQYKCVYNKP